MEMALAIGERKGPNTIDLRRRQLECLLLEPTAGRGVRKRKKGHTTEKGTPRII